MKQRYEEGDVFCFPIPCGRFALGVVARKAKGSPILLGYFFGRCLPACPVQADVATLTASDAIKIARFGDLGLRNGEWRVVGHIDDWDRELWPFPKFIRRDLLSNYAALVTYSDDDPSRITDEQRCLADDSAVHRYPPNLMHGYGAIEIQVGALLDTIAAHKYKSARSSARVATSPQSSKYDKIAIEENVRAGGSSSKPTVISFWIYFPKKSMAAAFSKAVQQAGQDVELRAPVTLASETSWGVRLIRNEPLTNDAIEAQSELLESLAE